MAFNLKNLFNDETEMLDDHTTEIEIIGDEKDIQNDAFALSNEGQPNRQFVHIYEPASANISMTIMDAMKKGDLCIVNFEKVSDEEARLIISTLKGSIYTMDGTIKKVANRIYILASKDYVIDGPGSSN